MGGFRWQGEKITSDAMRAMRAVDTADTGSQRSRRNQGTRLESHSLMLKTFSHKPPVPKTLTDAFSIFRSL